MNNYILSIMTSRGCRFGVKVEFEIDGETHSVNGVIDTGCSTSLFSADLLYPKYVLKHKMINDANDYIDNRLGIDKVSWGFGVESAPDNYKTPKTVEDVCRDKNIRFIKSANNMIINGYNFGDCNIRVSYTIKGKVLIGMDIIKHLNCFIGKYKGQVYFLATKNELVKTADLFELAKRTIETLVDNEDEYIDFSDGQGMEANYIHKLINGGILK